MKTSMFWIFGIILTGLVITSEVNAQTTSKKMVDIPCTLFLPCVPEMAVGKINLHVIINYDRNGFMAKYQAQPQGGELIGEDSGYTYRPTGVSHFTQKTWGNGAYPYSYTDIYHFAGQKGIQYKAIVKYHLTVNSNGEITAEVERSEVVCR